MRFPKLLKSAGPVLAEGAVIERLRRSGRVELDPHVLHAGFLYRPHSRSLLADMYRQYLEIGRQADLPMVILTPTWRASKQRLEMAGYAGRDVNGDAGAFLKDLRDGCGEYAPSVFIGGCIGPRGDAYRADDAPDTEQARKFHAPQVEALARAGVDFLMASTLPAAGEARGLGQAMAATGVPYVLSFILNRSGSLLDGTPLGEVVKSFDRGLRPAPAGYMANCVHHSVFGEAAKTWDDLVFDRLIGLQANTSSKRPEELDGATSLDGEDAEEFADGLAGLRRRYGLRILGGCCGTDHRHIRGLASRLRPTLII